MSQLFDRLGGHQAISLVVDKFYQFMLKDKRVAHYFNNTDMNKQRQSQKQFITLVSGGPNQYHGKDMKTAHKGMGINNMEFDATWENLLKALNHYNVPQKQINELKSIFYSVQEEIVENKTNNHETHNKNEINTKNNDPNLKEEQSLYEKLGGQEAIKLVVNKFYDFMLKDDRVNFYFTNTDMNKQRSSQIQFISMVTGGPVVYKGKDMKTAHCPYKITQNQFNATWQNLSKALNVYNVPNNLINQLKNIFYSVEDDIVNAKSQQNHKKQSFQQKCLQSQSSKRDQTDNNQQSLYQRLGGHDAVQLVVNKFYDLLLENPKVNFYFTNTDMKKQRRSQIQFLSMVTGGPVFYKGKDMKAAHCPYKITEIQFDTTWQSLQLAMRYYKVGDGLIKQVRDIFYSVQNDIVRQHKIGRRNEQFLNKALQEMNTHEDQVDEIKQQLILPVTISHTNNQQNQQPKNTYCPFSQHIKVTQQQKRQLKQQFIEKQHQTKQVKKLNNSPYQKTYY